jgi:signal transduction histidine kinase
LSEREPKKPRLQLKLRSKVTLLLLLLSLGPLLVSGFVNVDRAVEQAKTSVRQRHAQAVNLTAQAFSAAFAQADRDLAGIAQRFPWESLDEGAIRRRFDRTPQLPFRGPGAWQDFAQLEKVNATYDAVFLALPEGRVFFVSPWSSVKEPVDVSSLNGFDSAAHNEPMLGVLEPLTGPSRPQIFRVQAITDDAGTLLAWLGVVFEPGAFATMLEHARGTEQHTNLNLMVVDGHNQITAGRTNRVGRVAPDFVHQFGASNTAEFEINHETHLAARARIPRTRWTVFLHTRTIDAYREVAVLIWLLVAVIVLTFIFVTLLADYLASRLLQPIRALEQGARMLGGGALDYRIELAAHTGDELGRLAHAFNEMGENLQGSQQELRAYSRSLETANGELDAVVYGITHDLKKSLRGIDAFATFLEEDYADRLDAEGVDLLHGISGKVERINTLANDLVGIVEQERDRGEATAFDMAGLLAEVAVKVEGMLPGRIHIQASMPEIKADRAQIGLLFEQLIKNGLRFNRSADPEVHITYTDDVLDWRFDVIDNGIGISAEYHERIFEMFSRLNQTDQFPGSGTGLSLARRIAHEHRGHLDVESVLGTGTRFVVRLPKEPMLLTSPGFHLGNS